MSNRPPLYESVNSVSKPPREGICFLKSLNLKVMKSILQSFIFLFLFLIGTANLWGQCSITSATASIISCQNHGTDSPSDDAIQFNLLAQATSGSTQGFWIDVSGGTTVSPQEGTYGTTFAVVLGNGTAGSGSSYTLTLTDKSDLSCSRTVVINPQASCSAGCSTPIQFICDTPGNPGPQSVTLTATGGLTNVQWYNEADVNVGSGQLVVTTLTPGMSDGSETFRYEAADGTGCLVTLCCQITVQTQDCGFLDLALIKQKSDNLPVSIGQTITFNIQVCNQGTDPVNSVSLIDYVPSGFTFSPNNGWTASGSNAIRTLTPGSGLPPSGLAVNSCVTVPINLVVNSTVNTTNVLNIAEITAGTDTRGRTDDIDSTPDSTPTNDAGGAVGTPSDNVLTGDGSGTPGSSDPLTDEDDQDPATVRIVDLALIKEIISPAPYSYGSPITFRITVTNQGNETATNIVVSDYVPSGFTFAANNGWTGAAPLITKTITGPLAPGATTTVDLVLTPQASSGTNAWLNIAEISAFNDASGNPIGQFDIDSDPDQDAANDAGGLAESPADNYLNGNGTGTVNSGTAATDEDDQDPALIKIFDLALTKVLTTPAPYTYGQTHSFTITVYNQGNVAATDIVVNDYIPQGYTFTSNNGWTGGPSTITNTIAGPLAPGASTTLTLTLTFNAVASATTAKTWVNYSEIASAEDTNGNVAFDADSTPGSNGTNENNIVPGGTGDNDTASTSDTGVGSQDDHDPAGPKVFDLALRKTKETALPSFSYGQTVMYKIEIFNQGNIPATNIEVTDYLPCGFEFDATSATNTGWSLSGSKVTKTYTGVLNPGQSTSLYIDVIVRECYTNPDNAWVNYAEISRADDTDPSTPTLPTDVDSTPDATNGNDTGGVPLSNTDDTINNENGDEDDHDPVKIEVFDLALRKVLTTAAPYSVGQALTFNIQIFNQGNVTASNVVVSDYIPAGYTFAANNGWTGGPTVATTTIAGPIAPGTSVTVPLVLTLQQNSGGAGAWDNYAEITAAQDTNGNNRNDDADSVADNNPNNDNPVQPGDPDDDNVLGGGPNASEDEDDHDPAAPQIVDIALRKTTVTAGPYTYGDVVSFNVEVINQGNVDLSDIDVVDYIPCGFEYVSGSQTWVLNGTQAQTNIAGVLAAGASQTIRIDLRVKACSSSNAWLNYAEVRNMEDTNGNSVNSADIDSTPDNTNGNDDGGAADSANDDYVDGNGKATGGAPGDTATSTDEDDHDPELISVFDLALRKTLATAGPYTYGQPLTFNIEVVNQGNTAASNIVVSDYIPVGYSFNGGLNPTWSGAAPVVTKTIAGPLAAGASTIVTIVLNLEMSSGLNAWDNYAEVTSATDTNGNPVTDADSNPDGTQNNDPGGQIGSPADDYLNGDGTGTPGDGVASTDEDDQDGSRPRIVDLALRKTTNPSTPGPYRYGDVVSFDIQLTNQGNVTLYDIDVVDYIPCGFVYVNGSQPWSVSGTQATTVCAGSLAPGQSKTLRIDMRVQMCNGANPWTNYAEVLAMEDSNGANIGPEDIDSNPDANNTNDPGGLPNSPADDTISGDGTGAVGDGVAATDEDDHDPEFIEIFDLALRKTLTTGAPYTYGQDHIYTISVFNQGNVNAYNIEVQDYIPAGYSFNAAVNPGWTLSGTTASYVIPGPLAPNASTTVQIALTYNMTAGGVRNWINYAEIGSADNDQVTTNTPPVDADSTPDSNTPSENAVTPGSTNDDVITGGGPSVGQDEDDHDPAGPSFYDVALRKTTTATGPFSFGQIVKFDIEVLNQGNLPVRNPKVIDYIPAGFTGSALAANFPTWTFGPTSATTTLALTLQPGQSTTVSIYLQVVPTTNAATGWDNYAEVYQFEDTSGNNVGNQDVDSTPDTTPTNDPGGQPYSPADDFVDGNGIGTPGDGAASTDEDDHDPERIEIIDLALRKTLVTAGPYAYGDLLQFNIEVFNQGNEPMRNTQITDYIPAGFTFNLADNPGWVGAAPNPTYVIAGPILPGTSQLITTYLRIQQTLGGEKDWINYAEITDTYNNDLDPRNTWDIDSNPGSNGTGENAVEPGDPADNNITSHDKGGEEDDHDPAGIEIFDLALFMVDDTDILANYGDNVVQTITVTNQGSIASNGFDVTVYVPAGFTFNAANNPGWVNNGNGTVTYVSSEYLVPGETVQYALNLTAVPTKQVNGWVVYGEISKDHSVEPSVTTDIDSRPDATKTNDAGGAVNTTSDDVITGVGVDRNGTTTAPFGSTNPATDEDDHDPTMIRVYDMALYKSLKTAGPYKYGQVLDFDVCVVNQGNQVMTDVSIIDYLPAGFEYVAANNTAGIWTVSGSNLTANVAGPIAVCDTICLPLKLTVRQTTGGEKDWINYAEITGMQDENGNPQEDVDSNPSSDGPDERDVEPGDPADDDTTSIDEGGEEDDHDPAGIEVFDLAQRKVTVATGPFKYGDIVKFTYEVFNQGSIQASDIVVTDYIPCGFKFVSTSNNPIGWAYNLTTGNASVTLQNALAPGASTTVDIYLQVQPCIANSADAWTNIGEITGSDSDDPNEPPTDIDSDSDTDPNNDPGGEPDGPNDDVVDEDPDLPGDDDEDDQDPERIEVVDLALRKVMTTQGPYSYGQIIDFNIEVFNQGNVTMTNIEVADYIPQGFAYDPALNPTWQGAYPSVFTIIAGPLAPENSTSVNLKLKLVQTSGGAKVYTNGAEITAMDDDNGDPRDDDDADSTPDTNPDNDNPVTPGDSNDDVIDESPNDPNNPTDDDEDDSDPAGPKIFDLALRKKQQTALPSFSYGQNVVFDMELFNQGNIDAKDIVIIDTLPCGLEFLPGSAINAGWTYNAATREARYTYSNILVAGTTATVSLETKVIPCGTNVGKAWTNWSEIESANDNDPNTPTPPTDVDSDPDGNNTNDEGGQPNTPEDDEINGDPNNPDAPQDEDDHDPHQIEVFDLALRKIVDDRGPYMIGETATFRLKVYNQGNVPAQNIIINDYMRSGFSFNAGANPGWTLVTAPTPAADGLLNYTISTRLNPGDSIIIPLKLEIALDANPAVADWWNYGEIRMAQDTLENNRNDDADSTPNSDTPRENEVEPDGPWDNVIDGNGPNFNEDEDDHDPEKVIVVGGLGDTVWKDLDGDGIQDPAEPGVQGVVAILTDCNGNELARQTTDVNGFYFFNNLIPGNYQVHFDISALPQGCDFTYQNVGDQDDVDSDVNLQGYGPCTYITGGEFDSTYDAGLLILAAIGDYVWHDLNGDGLQTPGEPGIPGVQVSLYKGNGDFVGYVFTDNNGYYLFDFLYPGDYYLSFTAPQGMDLTFFNKGNDAKDSDVDGTHGEGTTATTTLSPGERDMTWDAGYYFCIPVGDLVWYDTNLNDVWNTNENGINGLTVNLWRNHFGTWVIWDYTLTGHKPDTPSDDGYWKFCAPPGEYYVEVIMPPLGLVRARPNIGTIEEIDSDITNANGLTTTDKFTVLSGQQKCDLGAGFYPQAQVGNLVWNDTNANGVQEASEPIVSGVLVQAVVAATGQVMSESVTGQDGTYKLENIEKADVFIRFAPPAGYGATAARVTDDSRDSDVDHSYGANTTRLLSMQPSMENFNIDMGVVFGVLPVDWLDINAVRKDDTHIISWTTAREVNVSHYEVERKLDGQKDFETLPEKVEAKGNTTLNTHYSKVDIDVAKPGVYVYRVKQVDFDGKFTYSPLAKVIHVGETSIGLYPNPARTSTSLEVVLSDDAELKVEMYDAASKLVRVIETPSKTKAGYHIFPIDIENIPVGVYNVIVNINGVETAKKLIRIE